MKGFINIKLGILWAAVLLVFLLLSIVCFFERLLPGAIFCLVLVAFYFYELSNWAAIIEISSDRVRLSFPGRKRIVLTSEEIEEVGIVEILPTNKRLKIRKNHGFRYIYFSPLSMDNEARFNLCLQWPPRDIPCIAYSEKALEAAKKLYSGEIVLYNVFSK